MGTAPIGTSFQINRTLDLVQAGIGPVTDSQRVRHETIPPGSTGKVRGTFGSERLNIEVLLPTKASMAIDVTSVQLLKWSQTGAIQIASQTPAHPPRVGTQLQVSCTQLSLAGNANVRVPANQVAIMRSVPRGTRARVVEMGSGEALLEIDDAMRGPKTKVWVRLSAFASTFDIIS